MYREERLCVFCNRRSLLQLVVCEYHLCMECYLYYCMMMCTNNVQMCLLTKFSLILVVMYDKYHRNMNELVWYIWKCVTVWTKFIDGELDYLCVCVCVFVCVCLCVCFCISVFSCKPTLSLPYQVPFTNLEC